jgi:amidase
LAEIIYSTASELAASIREKRLSSVEVVDAHLERIAERNPALNAVVTLDAEGARLRAREADEALARGERWGPLHGVPVTIKDSFETAGMRTSCGFPPLADYVPKRDATVVARLRAAGAVILGKTNLPPLAMDFQTNNPVFGATNNPWDLSRTPGGSTGGGAAALAAGLTPLEIGSDIAGSLRVPAHYCGVLSLKPTENRVPATGHIPGLPGAPRGVRHMGVFGPLARSVDDLDLALKLISGPDGIDWEVQPVPLDAAPRRSPAELHLAFSAEMAGMPVSASTSTAIRSLVEKLRNHAFHLDERGPDGFDFLAAFESGAELLAAEVVAGLTPEEEQQLAAQLGSNPDSADIAARGYSRGVSASLRAHAGILGRRDAALGSVESFLGDNGYDAWLLPVTVSPAIAHCAPGTPVAVDGQELSYFAGGLAYTWPFSFTGSPVVVLPIGTSLEGLPIGIQVVGRRWSEMALLEVARLIEAATGGFQRPPGY